MLQRLQSAGLILPGLLSLLGLTVLIGLGVWQIQRKTWKDHLVAQIEARSQSPPVSFRDALTRASNSLDDVAYLPVRVTGTMHHDQEMYFYAPDQKLGPGFHVYTPLEYAVDRVVWLNRGFVPERRLSPEARSDGQPQGQVTVIGLARPAPSSTSVFTPSHDLRRRHFYWRDLTKMHTTAYDSLTVSAVPFFVDLLKDGQPQSETGPQGGVTRLEISNRHLEYAVTWFGLAATLIGVFVAFAWTRLKVIGQKQSHA